MTDITESGLDTAYGAMMAAPEDDAARMRYYARLADGMLYLMLEAEADGGAVEPVVVDIDGAQVVLAYDTEERLAATTDAPVPYAELPGRVIAAQLAGQNVALGVNLGVGAAEFLVSPEALIWLSQTLDHAPANVTARPIAFEAPRGLPTSLMQALDGKLARAGGLAQAALLAAVRYEDGRQGHMLAFIGAAPGAEAALTRAASEALTFSGVEAGEMDVTFLAADLPVVDRMARVALRFDLPAPAAVVPAGPAAPGMDPLSPPKLR
ncbi:SseB family protein [Pseudorhodobacter ferrugineus]|uniref:SseB family protein n=1 Tax=Pseudorhodobacter ferrugineus TaxID=77008 RepID=UPI0003B7B17E|nr:SseB family protein [Pseudorhodobacter ferrugineus]